MQFSQFASLEFKCTNYLWTIDHEIQYPEVYSTNYQIHVHQYSNSPLKLYEALKGTRNPDFVYEKLKEMAQQGYGIELVEPCYSRTKLHFLLRRVIDQ